MPRNLPQTEEDFLAMQQEAIRRVRQMQQRARRTLEDAGMNIETPPAGPAEQAQAVFTGPETEPMPVLPHPAPVWREPPPPEPEVSEPEVSEPEVSEPDPPVPETPPPFQNALKPIFNFSIDNEQLILIGILFLLFQDKADNMLILALVYILL